MKKNVKITGIKKAIGEYKNWIAQDWRKKCGQIVLLMGTVGRNTIAKILYHCPHISESEQKKFLQCLFCVNMQKWQ